MELVSEAIEFAVRAHDGMRRKKSEIPYILHPLEVAVIVGSMTSDQNVIAAAVLHDVVEDTNIEIEEIENKFGKRVTELVSAETENKREELPADQTWLIRKEESLKKLEDTNDIDVIIVWLGDKLANMRSIYHEWSKSGDKMWDNFNQKDVNAQAWYYNSILKLTERLSNTIAWQEYKTLTQLLFNRGVK